MGQFGDNIRDFFGGNRQDDKGGRSKKSGSDETNVSFDKKTSGHGHERRDPQQEAVLEAMQARDARIEKAIDVLTASGLKGLDHDAFFNVVQNSVLARPGHEIDPQSFEGLKLDAKTVAGLDGKEGISPQDINALVKSPNAGVAPEAGKGGR